MKYLGSKNRIANEILPIILQNRNENKQWYVEPFCGGLGTMDKVKGLRLASDKNKYLIAMWRGLQKDRDRPYNITKELYNKARNEYNKSINEEFDDFLIGWIGWMGSFNGRFFDGGYSGKTETRDYIAEQIRNTEKQIPLLNNLLFRCQSYDKLHLPPNSLVFCDPPYKDTKQYSVSNNFNHDEFWQWCRNKTNENHKVFISEYQAPVDFQCIWQKDVKVALHTNKTYDRVEKLFIYNE